MPIHSQGRCWPSSLAVLALLAASLISAGIAEAQVLVPNLVYTSVTPCRVFDTRSSTGGKLIGGTSQTFNIVGNTTGTYFTNQGGPSGGCSIPGFFDSGPQVQAVVINIAVVAPSSAGFLKAWASDHSSPGTSLINYAASTVIANGAVVAVRQDSQGGDITLASSATTDAFGDIVGYFSAGSVTPTSGTYNVFIGPGAGNQGSSSSTGGDNVGLGRSAMAALTTGNLNTAAGWESALNLTTGADNVALGATALNLATGGTANVAVGARALYNLETGQSNIAIGYFAGEALLTSESNNLDIGNSGVIGESGVIRIGDGNQTSTYIAGISGVTSSSGTAVYVNSSGQLGTTTSALRFKQDVEDMGETSQGLMRLRPVTFHYRPQYDDGARLLQFGLIAEEVAKVYPDLVQYDQKGQALAVRYQFVDAMLLNEVQRQHRAIEAQQAQIEELQRQLSAFVAQHQAATTP
jgi:hypothetical protein